MSLNRSRTDSFVSSLIGSPKRGQKIVVTNGFIKKQQKLPKPEKERALRMMEDYKHRIQEDTYYEEG